MKKKINIILGALIALLCGCKTQKEIGVPSERIMVMYGPPAYFQNQNQPTDIPSQETLQENNSTKESIAK